MSSWKNNQTGISVSFSQANQDNQEEHKIRPQMCRGVNSAQSIFSTQPQIEKEEDKRRQDLLTRDISGNR